VVPPIDLWPQRQNHNNRPLSLTDVFVDDKIQVAQGSSARLNRIRHVLLHCNDMVFRPNDKHDEGTPRKEPMSLSKFAKGDACWSTLKVTLGWLLDTLQKNVEFPSHRKERLLHILRSTSKKRQMGTRAVHRLLGELRSMVLGIPGGQGLFSQLQLALTQKDGHRVRIHDEARHLIEDFLVLVEDLANRPTHIAEIIPQPKWVWGVCGYRQKHLTTIHQITRQLFGEPHSQNISNNNWYQSAIQVEKFPIATWNWREPLHMLMCWPKQLMCVIVPLALSATTHLL
jgi:hypothetical protein